MPSFDLTTRNSDIAENEISKQRRSASVDDASPQIQGRLQPVSAPDNPGIGPHPQPLGDHPPQHGWKHYQDRLHPQDNDVGIQPQKQRTKSQSGPSIPPLSIPNQSSENSVEDGRSRLLSDPTGMSLTRPDADLARNNDESDDESEIDQNAPRQDVDKGQYTRKAHVQQHIDHLAQKNLSRDVKSAFNPHTGRFSSTSRYRWAKGYEHSLMQTDDGQDGDDIRPSDLKQRLWNEHGGPPGTTQQRLWRLRDQIQKQIPILNRALDYESDENPFLHIEELRQEVQANPLTARAAAKKVVALHQELLDLEIDPYQDLAQLKQSVGKDQSMDNTYGNQEKLKDLSDALGKMEYLQGKRMQLARCTPTADAYDHVLSNYREQLDNVTKELDRMIDNLELPNKISAKRKAKAELESMIRVVENSRDDGKIAKELEKKQAITRQVNDYMPKSDAAKDKAIELGVELASKARIGFDEQTERFAKSHFNIKIDRKVPLFSENDLEKRQQLIDEAEDTLDRKREDLEKEPPSVAKQNRTEKLWPEEEKICLAKEELYRKQLGRLVSKKAIGDDATVSHRREVAIYKRLLQNTLQDKHRIQARKNNALREKNRASLNALRGDDQKLFRVLQKKFPDIRDAHGAFGSMQEWKRSQSTLAKVSRAWNRFWAGAFKSVDIAESGDKTFAETTEELNESLSKSSDKLETTATKLALAEHTLGVVKSHHKLWHSIKAAFRRKTPENQSTEEAPEKNTLEWTRSAPQRLLRQAKSAGTSKPWYKKFLGFWKKTDIPTDLLDSARYDVALLGDSAKLSGAKGAFWSAMAGKTVAKGTAIAGAAVTAKEAVQSGVEAHEARMDDQKRSQALKKTKEMLEEQNGDNDAVSLQDSLRDLDSLVALGEKKGKWKRKAVGAGVNSAASTGFVLTTIAGFGVGGAAVAAAAPVVGGAAAAGAVGYAVYKEGKEYVDAETLKLHEDAFIGRAGGKTIAALNDEAQKSGSADLRTHLDRHLIRSDTRYATQRTLINLKREMRVGYTETQLKDHLQTRIDAKANRLNNDEAEIDIYDYDREDDVFKDFDDRRLKASPHAQFLMQMGMPRKDVLALADSRDDERTNEACRQLIQMSLRLKG